MPLDTSKTTPTERVTNKLATDLDAALDYVGTSRADLGDVRIEGVEHVFSPRLTLKLSHGLERCRAQDNARTVDGEKAARDRLDKNRKSFEESDWAEAPSSSFSAHPEDFETADYHTRVVNYRHDCGRCAASGRHDCGSCDARGTVGCGQCRRSGEEQCPSCRGYGKFTCTTCGGHRMIQVYVRDPSHPSGGYHTPRTCNRCDHLGKQGFCWPCRGSGRIDCRRCGGGGRLVCGTCEGGRQVDCARCGATGTATSGLALRTALTGRVSDRLEEDSSLTPAFAVPETRRVLLRQPEIVETRTDLEQDGAAAAAGYEVRVHTASVSLPDAQTGRPRVQLSSLGTHAETELTLDFRERLWRILAPAAEAGDFETLARTSAGRDLVHAAAAGSKKKRAPFLERLEEVFPSYRASSSVDTIGSNIAVRLKKGNASRGAVLFTLALVIGVALQSVDAGSYARETLAVPGYAAYAAGLLGFAVAVLLAHLVAKRRRRGRRIRAIMDGTGPSLDIGRAPLRPIRASLVVAAGILAGEAAAIWAMPGLDTWSCSRDYLSPEECAAERLALPFVEAATLLP